MLEISDNVKAQLSEWYSQKAVLGLMGEFSAGKSTLVNMLIDRPTMRTQVTATQLPAVWLTYGPADQWHGLRPDGEVVPVDIEDLGDTARADFVLLRATIASDFLKDIDLVDAPGISDPQLQKGATLYLGPYMDGVFWCSSATQAWRQSEKKTWTSFPPTLRRRSSILLTRSDKLRRKSDVSRVANRVSRDTKDLFAHVLPINTPAIGDMRHDTDRDVDLWKAVGGEGLFAQLKIVIDTAQKRVAQTGLTGPESTAQDESPTEPTVMSQENSDAATLANADSDIDVDVLALFRDSIQTNGKKITYDQLLTKLDHLKAELASYKTITPTQRFALNQCLNVGEGRNVKMERLLSQVEQEITDFRSDNWCNLSPYV